MTVDILPNESWLIDFQVSLAMVLHLVLAHHCLLKLDKLHTIIDDIHTYIHT